MTDFLFTDHGSITVLTAISPAAKRWVDRHLPSDRMTLGPNGSVIEPRYIGDIIQGVTDDGLSVST